MPDVLPAVNPAGSPPPSVISADSPEALDLSAAPPAAPDSAPPVQLPKIFNPDETPAVIPADSPEAASLTAPAPTGEQAAPAVLPAGAEGELLTKPEYLKTLPSNSDVVAKYIADHPEGDAADKKDYEDAFIHDTVKGNFFGRTQPSEGPAWYKPASLWTSAKNFSESMWVGAFSHASALTGMAAHLYGGMPEILPGVKAAQERFPDAQFHQDAAELAAGQKTAIVRDFASLYRGAANVWNASLIALGDNNEEGIRRQFNDEVKVQRALLRAQAGKSVVGEPVDETVPIDRPTAANISASPGADFTQLLPMVKGAQAAKAATAGARAMTVVEEGAALAPKANIAARTAARTAELATTVLKAGETTFDKVSPTVRGAVAGGAVLVGGGGILPALGAAVLGGSKYAAAVDAAFDATMAALTKSSQWLRAPGPFSKATSAMYASVAPAAKGYAQAGLYMMPFALGAKDYDEAMSTIMGGMQFYALGQSKGVFNSLSPVETMYRAASRAPTERGAITGGDFYPELNAAHHDVMKIANNSGNNLVQAARNLLAKLGGGSDLYLGRPEALKQALLNLQKSGHVFYDPESKATIDLTAPALGPDGTSILDSAGKPISNVDYAMQQYGVNYTLSSPGEGGKPGAPAPREVRSISLVPFKEGAPAISVGHELWHAVEHILSPEERAHFQRETMRVYGGKTPEELAAGQKHSPEWEGARRYYAQQAGIDPHNMSDASVASELMAENFSGRINALAVGSFGPQGDMTFKNPAYRRYVGAVASFQERILNKLGGKVPQTVTEVVKTAPDGTQYKVLEPAGKGAKTTGLGFESSSDLGHIIDNFLESKRLDTHVSESQGHPDPFTEKAPPAKDGNPITNTREVAPPPAFKKGDPIGDVTVDGKVFGTNAIVEKVIESPDGKHQYEIEYTDPEDGKRKVGTVPETALQSPVKPGAGAPVPKPKVDVGVLEPVPEELTHASETGAPVKPQVKVAPQPSSGTSTPAKPANVRVTPAQQEAFGKPDTGEAPPELQKTNTDILKAAVARPRAEIPAFEAEVRGAAADEQGPEADVRKAQRLAAERAEQSGFKNPLKRIFSKLFVPYKFLEGATPRVFGFSGDKLIQNLSILHDWATRVGFKDLAARLESPDLTKMFNQYLENQRNGYGGGGERLVRPADAKPGSVTPENPDYTPHQLPELDRQLANLLMGFPVPRRSTPVTEWHAKMARENGISPVTDANGVEITNPLYTQLVEAGLDPRILNAAVENLPVKNFTSELKPRTDIKSAAGDVAITRAGFMPKAEGPVEKFNDEQFKRFYSIPDSWMDPDGKLFPTGKLTHNYAAAEHLKKPLLEAIQIEKTGWDPNYTDELPNGVAELYKRGWVRVVNESGHGVKRMYVSHGDVSPNSAQTRELTRLAINKGSELLTDGPRGSKELYSPPVGEATKFMPRELSTPESLKATLRDKDWAIISASKADRTPEQNAKATRELAAHLQAAGHEVTPVEGNYGGTPEQSFFVHNITSDEAHAFGNKFGQESVLVPEGLRYNDNSLHPHDGSVETSDSPFAENYSTLPNGLHFQYGIDFGKKVPPPKLSEVKAPDDNTSYAVKPRTLADLPEATRNSLKNFQRIEEGRKLFGTMMPKSSPQHAGEPLEHAVGGELKLIHFSGPGLKEVSPDAFGKSGFTPRSELAGAPRSYFYEQGKQHPSDVTHRPEVYGATVSGDRIYDGDKDPLGYSGMINRWKADEMLQDAGYVGIARTGKAGKKPYRQIELFEPTRVQRLANPGAKFMPKATPVQEKMLKDSKVRDAEGNLLPVVHGTYNDFKKFNVGDLGYHFGTANAANARIGHTFTELSPHFGEIADDKAFDAFREIHQDLPPSGRAMLETLAEGARNIPVFLDLKNPLRMRDVGPWDDPGEVWHALEGMGGIVWAPEMRAVDREVLKYEDKINEYAGPMGGFDEAKAKFAKPALAAIREGLKKLGYDGIVYANDFEGKAAEDTSGTFALGDLNKELAKAKTKAKQPPAGNDSYIAFDNKQIVPAYAKNPRARWMPKTDNLGFYSNIEKSLEDWQPKGTPEQLMAHLAKTGGTKEEASWIGLDDFLKDKKSVTKEEVAKFVAANKVELQEVTHAEVPVKQWEQKMRDINNRIEVADGVSYRYADKLEAYLMDVVPAETRMRRDLVQGEIPILLRHGELKVEDLPDAESRRLAENFLEKAKEKRDLQEQREELENARPKVKPVKYAAYRLPGGENYREHLLTMPETKFPLTPQERNELTALRALSFDEQMKHVDRLNELNDRERAQRPTFTSHHWREENIVVHTRTTDRLTPGLHEDSKPNTLMLEEIQSDLHQKGRSGGYYTPQVKERAQAALREAIEHMETKQEILHAAEKAFDALSPLRETTKYAEASDVLDEARKGYDDAQRKVQEARARAMERVGDVPDFPFKTSWPKLALKRMIALAAQEGKEQIAWTTGKQQSDRYQLSKQISRITLSEARRENQARYLAAYDHNGTRVVNELVGTDDSQIADYIGKEAAEKLLNEPLRNYQTEDSSGNPIIVKQRALSGLDLNVGGEGMKAFYDKMLPDMANQLGKKYGAKVEMGKIQTDQSSPGLPYNRQDVHVLKITPAMREAALKGQPMFMPKGKAEKLAVPGEGEPQDVLDTPEFRDMARGLTDDEAAGLRRDTARSMLETFKELPPDEEFMAAAKAGAIKRGWYARAAATLKTVFGPDTERFVSLLAATSPRQSVLKNLHMALAMWADWNDAGRPQDTKAIHAIVEKHAELYSRIANSVKALQGLELQDEPGLSGYKVESFRRNLLGDMHAVTNDSWMAQFANLDGAIFGTRAGYLAYTAKVRKVAKKLGMTPAEVQETVWSFFKTLKEGTNVNRSSREALRSLDDSHILNTPEFHDQVLNDPHVRAQLERLGFTGFDDLAGAAHSSLPAPRAGSLAEVALKEGGTRRLGALGRIADRAQAAHDAGLAAPGRPARLAGVASAPDPTWAPVPDLPGQEPF